MRQEKHQRRQNIQIDAVNEYLGEGKNYRISIVRTNKYE